MSFIERDALIAADVFRQFGAPAVFTPFGGAPVNTTAIVDRETVLQGELGQVVDPRPSIDLPKAAVGASKAGKVVVDGKTWALDQLISDDGHVVRFFVK